MYVQCLYDYAFASSSTRDMHGINLGAGLLNASLPLGRWPHQQLFLLVLCALSLAVVDDVHAQLLDTDAQHCDVYGILLHLHTHVYVHA